MRHREGMRTAARIGFWPLTGAVVFLALCPTDLFVPSAGPTGYPQHALAFATLAVTGTLARGLRWRFLAALVALAMVLELAQAFSPGRHLDLLDLLAGLAGISVGTAVLGAGPGGERGRTFEP